MRRFLNWIFNLFKKNNTKSNSINSHSLNQIAYVKPHFVLNNDKISYTLVTYFSDFIELPTRHYNAMLDVLHQDSAYRAKYDFDSKLSLAIDYFKRNRSRLFEWWCMKNDNILMSDDIFNVLYDMYGFNYAFEKRCREMFDVDVKCDENINSHPCTMIDEHGNENKNIIIISS